MNKSLIVLIVIIISSTIMYFVSGIPQPTILTCTKDVFICRDGSRVRRVEPKCEFAACPTIIKKPEQVEQGKFCGGIAGILCPEGYDCNLDGNYPDAAGVCVKNSDAPKFSCPETEWVDCMPGPGGIKSECDPQYLNWAQANCPNFKGAAY
ncbi:MAG: hypothetical protein NUV58_04170 [Candidatus Roizmanbacteria bacterium]|nr:hypothetical protein [Candidatus Roizmanbacteria bacterium]